MTHENIQTFENEIKTHYGDPGHVLADGRIHRFGKNKVCWYVGFQNGDFIAGAFGSWKEGSKNKWCSKNGTRTDAEQAFFKKCMEDADKQQAKLRKKAKRRAAFILKKANPAPDDHPYLIKKGIKAHGAMLYKGALVIPVNDKDGETVSIQFISGDGTKRFLAGGKVAGGSFTIPGDENQILCEGYATGASVHEATGASVRIAFNAGNLVKVAEPGWIIAGDNDAFTKNRHGEPWNPGCEKTMAAGWKYNCRVVIPTFPDTGTKPTDFNDLHSLEGLEAVKTQMDGAVYPQEFLLKELESDVGAVYRPEHLEGLRNYRERNRAGYMTLRGKLKQLHVGVTELEKMLKGTRKDNGGGHVNHLTLAREVVASYGKGNLIHSGAFTRQWGSTGVWKILDDRELKQAIHVKIENAVEDPTKSIIDSILDLVKTEVFKPGHIWDVDQTTINCLNGEITWTGNGWILKPHCREHYRTTQIPIVHDPNSPAPQRFIQFLQKGFQDDPDSDQKQVLICELIGYTLLSTARYEKFILLIGRGANGKSVLMDVVVFLVGLLNVCAVQPSQFENRFQRAHLHNKLMNCVTELKVGAEIHDAQLKAIVSGELTTAEHKHKPPFDFQPYATCWFGTNHMPHTRDFSDALFRRTIIIPFNRVFAEHEQDKRLKDKLKNELPGILNLALEGMAGVIERGYFTTTDSCEQAKREWRLNADQAAEFIFDECQLGANFSIESGHLYEAYRRWAEDAGIRKTLNRKNFTQRITRFGAEQGRGNGGKRVIFGIDLVV